MKNNLGWLLILCGAALADATAHAAETTLLNEGDTRIHVHLDPGEFALPASALLAWVGESARTVAGYYGRLPVPDLYVALLPVDGAGVTNGKAFGIGEATINVRLGRDSTQAHLNEDWIMIHEMIHFAFPRVDRRHHWIEEGLAVYVESVARTGAGELAPEFVWDGFVRGMPHGLPRAGDAGLDHTPTWGRTYWGGALYCLLADIEIRRRSGNRRSLRDALRAIVDAGISMLDERPLEDMLRLGDAATGETVLMELYRAHRATALGVDLEGLWRDLGVRPDAGGVRFDDAAPLALIRTRITAPDPAPAADSRVRP